jgi:Domain of unknown function (DUF4440)
MVCDQDAAPGTLQLSGEGMPPARRWAMRRAMRCVWSGALVVVALFAFVARSWAQQASAEDSAVLAADAALGDAMRTGDKSAARRLLSLQFTFADENGKVHERKEFLDGLKNVAPGTAMNVKVSVYGQVAMVTGNRKSALGNDAFFLDILAEQKNAWRTLTMQDVVLAKDSPPVAIPPIADAKPYECKNPCETIPYRVRSPAEQDIVNAFQAMEKARIAHDAEAWGKHVAEEFVLYRSGHAPFPRAAGIATIEQQKQDNTSVRLSEIEAMRLSVYGDGASMITTQVDPDSVRPSYRDASVWVKRNGQWQLAIGVETEIK